MSSKQTVAFVGFPDATRRLRREDPLARAALASARLRVYIPALELAKRFQVYLVSFDDFVADPHLAKLGGAAAVVFRKLSTSEVLKRAHVAHYVVHSLRDLSSTTRVVADMSDDYSATLKASRQEELEDYQRELLQSCTITVPCQALADRLAPDAPHGVRVVEDPFEGPQGTPRAPGEQGLRVCWFGNPLQLEQVGAALSSIAERFRDRPLSAEIVTAKAAAGFFQELAQQIAARRADFRLRFTEWSVAETWRALRDCDAVLLPQDPSVPWGKVKSHNRLVESIRAGRIAVGSPIPSYQELSAYAWIGDDLAEGVAWALANPREAQERVRLGQEQLAQRFSPAAVARKWAATLGLEGQAG